MKNNIWLASAKTVYGESEGRSVKKRDIIGRAADTCTVASGALVEASNA